MNSRRGLMISRNLLELENDLKFQHLNKEVNSFNILKVLRLENHEIRHSNILAWLLNPGENHHLRDYFLRKFLEHIILIEENSNNPRFDQLEKILDYSLMDCHVFREVKTNKNRFIDLVIVNQQNKFVIFIENKFYSTESENQLDDYLRFVENSFHDFTIIPVYLTLDGEEPSNLNYFSMTYERIEEVLHNILIFYKDQVTSEVYQFIKDYDQILKEKFFTNQDQILLAIDLYRNHKFIIEKLFETTSTLYKPLHFETGYLFEFMMKYKDTINYIYKHGQNILSYSFEKFIKEQFKEEVLFYAHPTNPYFLPPEWNSVGQYPLREENYWLGKGLVVWFEQTKDQRLRLVTELGPIEYEKRLYFLNKIEKLGISVKESSKFEKARYTKFFTKKMDINKWDDLEELAQGMLELYNSSEFTLLRKQVANILEGKNPTTTIENMHSKSLDQTLKGNDLFHQAFRQWMELKGISTSNYRVTTRNVSFKIPLFDKFKEKLGETREKWWWHNGPFLFWLNFNNERLYFTLEIGPIETNKRVQLMENLQEQGIHFNKKGLSPEAKFTRIYTQTVQTEGFNEEQFIKTFEEIYNNRELQNILEKLELIYASLNEDY